MATGEAISQDFRGRNARQATFDVYCTCRPMRYRERGFPFPRQGSFDIYCDSNVLIVCCDNSR